MQVSVSSFASRLALVLLISLPSTAVLASDEPVGRVMVAMGGVTAEREGVSSRGLGRRDAIYAGDRIRTSARGRVQIRFEDGAMVDLDPSSTFEVEEYETDDDDGGGSVVMSFLKGAMRTITGAIGAGSGESYRMNTSVATLGVRGTAYSLRYCDAACASEGGEQGLYGRVDDGAVSVDGAGGMGTFGAGQFFFVPDSGTPRRIVAPPEGILDGGDEGGDEGGDDEQIEDVQVRPLESGGEDGATVDGDGDDLLNPEFEQGENEDLVTRPGESIDAAFSGAFIGSSGFAVYESPGGGDVREDEDGRIVGAEFDGYGFVDASGLEHTGGVTELIDIETEETFEVSWGSWSAGSGTVEPGGVDGFVYASTDPANFTTPTELSGLEGSLTYGGEPGGTGFSGPDAIDQAGIAWSVDGLQIDVDFLAGSIIGAGIALSLPDETSVSVTDFGLDVSLNADGGFSVSGLSGTADYSGEIQGRFLGRNAEGALVAFEVAGEDNRIVGTQVLEEQGAFVGDGDLIEPQ